MHLEFGEIERELHQQGELLVLVVHDGELVERRDVVQHLLPVRRARLPRRLTGGLPAVEAVAEDAVVAVVGGLGLTVGEAAALGAVRPAVLLGASAFPLVRGACGGVELARGVGVADGWRQTRRTGGRIRRRLWRGRVGAVECGGALLWRGGGGARGEGGELRGGARQGRPWLAEAGALGEAVWEGERVGQHGSLWRGQQRRLGRRRALLGSGGRLELLLGHHQQALAVDARLLLDACAR
eukprot:1770754-Pleurochrysis_carterae.AAC.3